MKILITDILFPNKFARWRNVEILSFIEKYETDILVYKTDSFAGRVLDFDWTHSIFEYALKDYNIIIFDPKYNHLNKYNKRIDGTIFNGKNSASYLLTKADSFDLNEYDLVYHIFLMNYERFNSSNVFDKSKQAIHLYPGGGLTDPKLASTIDSRVRLITTHPYTSQFARDKKFTEALIATMLMPNDSIISNIEKNHIGVCFSSLGFGHAKGDKNYLRIVDYYREKYSNDDRVKFFSVGNCEYHPNIIQLDPMDYISLNKFYRETIDIYLNLENGSDFNGWPLGIDAAMEGAVILTTDARKSNDVYKVPHNSYIIINAIDQAAQIIKDLSTNRDLLLEHSVNTKEYLDKIITYDNQQKRIFNFIES
jgi:hypothetical protein